MTPERWQQIKEVFQAALELDQNARSGFLDHACGDDAELRKEVDGLLTAHAQTANIVDQSVFQLAARLIEAGDSDWLIGRRIGPYQITREIGRGGMGEVYLAQDARLGRRVAIKLLPARFTFEEDRVRRFQQEARAASALNHPNIVTIHEIGEHDGLHFIVTEFIEGHTLRALIGDGLAINQALEIAIQAAGALAAAHQVGIIHRDIKPENIMLRPDGYVKVLDFGLAKLSERTVLRNDSGEDISWLDTSPGIVMGTVSYMSPEQVRGFAVDARTDIFALGVVLYEMLTGRKPFAGETTSDVIAAILEREPQPLGQLRDEISYDLQRIVNKALAKDREWRYQSIKELLIDLTHLKEEMRLDWKLRQSGSGNVSGGSSGARAGVMAQGEPYNYMATRVMGGDHPAIKTGDQAAQPTAPVAPFFSRILGSRKMALLALVLIVLTGLGFLLYRRLSSRAPVTPVFEKMRLSRITNTGNVFGTTISPDGKYILYVARQEHKAALQLRQLSTGSEVQLAPPASVSYWGFTFTNDGSYVYYHYGDASNHAGVLFRVPVLGGTPKKILDNIGGGVRFSPDDTRMIFARNDNQLGGRVLVSANIDGSDEQVIITPSQGFTWTYDWSPDGKTIACSIRKQDERGQPSWQVMEISPDGRQSHPVTAPRKRAITGLCWLPDKSAIIVTAVDETTSLQQVWYVAYATGEMHRITNDLMDYRDLHITADGKTLVASQQSTVSNVWVADSADIRHAQQITSGLGAFHEVYWTSDNKLLYRFVDNSKADIWEMAIDGTARKQLTSESGNSYMPAASADGRTLVFTSSRTGLYQVWRSDRDGRNQKQLTDAPSDVYNPCVTPDGQWLLYQQELSTDWTVLKMPINGGPSVSLTEGKVDSWALSPDGKWLAYRVYDEQKKNFQILIKSFEGGTPMKTLDGADLEIEAWARDGKALFCLHRNGVEITLLYQTANHHEMN
jgi:Tol biopolymer transport system component/tRNA A-37 threonylcarbamoyl transferase component Bud32